MNTLLHICCAPCANQCIEVLRGIKSRSPATGTTPTSTLLRNTAPVAIACVTMLQP